MTAEELLAALQRAESSAERMQIISQAYESGGLTGDTDISSVVEWVKQNAPEDLGFLLDARTKVPQGAGQLQSPAVEQQKVTDQTNLNAQYQTAATDPKSPGGVQVTDEEKAVAGQAGAELTIPTFDEPQWVLDMQNAPLTEDQRQRLVDYVNFFYGASFDSFEQLVASGYLDEPTAQNMQDVTAAIQDDTVYQSFSWTLPSGDLFTVKADEWQTTQATYGLDAKALKGLINIADKFDLRNGPTRLNWQPVVALAQATGMLETLKPKEVTFTVGGPGGNEMQPIPRQTVTGTLEQDPNQAGTFNRPMGPNVNPNVIRGERLNIQTKYSFREVVEEFQKGLQLFNYDPGMAYVYALDPTLAGRLASGGIPRGEDLYRLSGLVAEGGFKSSEDWRARMVEMGYAEAERTAPDLVSNYLGWLDAKNKAEDSMKVDATQETVREMPDPARIDEVMRALYQEMFLQEPDDQTLATFRSRITAAIQSAQPGESVDLQARAMQFMREDPRYGQLYGNRPANVDEASYRNQFRAGQATMLGNELAGNQPVLAGMRSGKYQTTIGAAAGTSEAWDNSTFLGRLARAAQVVGENT